MYDGIFQRRENKTWGNLMLKLILCMLSCVFFLSSCTYSITMVHTQGQATDVVDEAQTAQPDVSPTVSLPVSAI